MKNDRFKLDPSDLDIWIHYIKNLNASNDKWIPKQTYIDSLSRKLDLHGHHLHDAWQIFKEFIEQHHSSGTKSVVVITGKSGQIAKEFKEWCRLLPIIARYEALGNSLPAGSYRIVLKKGV